MNKLKVLLAFTMFYLMFYAPCFSQDSTIDDSGIKLGVNLPSVAGADTIVGKLITNLLDNKEAIFGLKLGVNRHWKERGTFNFEANHGLLFGMYMKRPLGKFVATNFEGQVIQMGYRINNTIDPNLDKIVINRTYLQVNPGLCFTPVKFIDIYADASLGVLIKNKTKWFYRTGVEEGRYGSLRIFDIGAKFGVNVWLNRIGVGVEYYHGLINTDMDIDVGTEYISTNHAFAITAKYTIN